MLPTAVGSGHIFRQKDSSEDAVAVGLSVDAEAGPGVRSAETGWRRRVIRGRGSACGGGEGERTMIVVPQTGGPREDSVDSLTANNGLYPHHLVLSSTPGQRQRSLLW